MKFYQRSILSLILTFMLANTQAQEEPTVNLGQLIEGYRQTVIQACPSFWEELTAKIDLTDQASDLWADDVIGREEFINFIRTSMGDKTPDEAGLNTMANDALTVATECATQKMQLMQSLVVEIPKNILNSMQVVSQAFGTMIGEGELDSGEFDLELGGAANIPPGSLLSYLGATLPKGRYLWAQGQVLNRDEYKRLFAAIGTTYGDGDGTTTFNLPDSRNMMLRGASTDEEVGAIAGEDSIVLTKANLPAITLTSNTAGNHTHGINAGGNHRHKYANRKANGWRGVKGGGAIHDSTGYTGYSGNHAHTMKAAGNHAHTTPLGGSDLPISTLPKHIKTRFIIAY